MNTSIKKLPKSEIEIKISVPWEEWENFIGKAVEEISKDMKVKGFRPGKAPRKIVEEKIGKGAILEAAAQKTVRVTYSKAIQKEKIETIGSPQVEITKLAEGNNLEYKAVTAVMPEVVFKPWQGEIKKVNKKHAGKKAEISAEEIGKELARLAKSRVKLVTVNREARKGDSVELNFQVKRGGVPIENGTSRNHPMILGSGVFIPGFEDNVIGMKEGEEKEFELEFPEKYHEKTLAGKPATFKVKVNLVQERQIPEVDADFARSMGKFENLEKLEESLSKGLLEEKESRQKEEKRVDFLEKLIECMDADIPDVLIYSELHKMIEEFKLQLEGMGMNIESYLEKMGKKEEDLEKEWAPQAEKKIKGSLALEQIAKDVAINVSSAEIEAEMNKIIQYYKTTKDIEKNIDMERLYNYAKGQLQNEEVFKYLENL